MFVVSNLKLRKFWALSAKNHTRGEKNCSNRDMQECPWRWRIHLQYKHIKFACILTHLLPSQLKTTLHPLFDRLLSHVSNRSSIEDKLVSISDLDTDCFSTVTHLAVLTLLWQAISGQKVPLWLIYSTLSSPKAGNMVAHYLVPPCTVHLNPLDSWSDPLRTQ